MDLAALNDAGITLCGLLGVAVFYFVGKREVDEKKKEDAKKENTEKK